MKGIYFITGIDTNIGKTYATGWLAKKLKDENKQVITQKLVQTGNTHLSEDIITHRKIMQEELRYEDVTQLTCPVIYSYPASPHLAASLENKEIPLDRISLSTNVLASRYEIVLLEGAGGLMVPLKKEINTIDYIQMMGYPVILVTNGRLGSLNHTYLSLEILRTRKIPVYAVLYNWCSEADAVISPDSFNMIKLYLEKYLPDTILEEVPEIIIQEEINKPVVVSQVY